MNVRDKTTGPAFFDPLESLRGVAALVVVIFHATWTNPVSSLRFIPNTRSDGARRTGAAITAMARNSQASAM